MQWRESTRYYVCKKLVENLSDDCINIADVLLDEMENFVYMTFDGIKARYVINELFTRYKQPLEFKFSKEDFICR